MTGLFSRRKGRGRGGGGGARAPATPTSPTSYSFPAARAVCERCGASGARMYAGLLGLAVMFLCRTCREDMVDSE